MDQQNPNNQEPETESLNDLLTDLFVENDIEITGGGGTGCPPWRCGFNHNETTAGDDEAETAESLADLPVGPDAQIKGGAIEIKMPDLRITSYQTGVHNHNETALEDEEAEPEAIADLPIENDEQVKAGAAGGGGGAGKVSLQDLHFTTTVAR